MGHEIVYCVRCATRLAGADFNQGRAFRAGGRIVCADCLPHVVATLTPDEQQNVISLSSTKMKPVKSAAPPSGTHGTSVRLVAQHSKEPAAPKSSMGLILAGVGVTAVLGILIAVFMSRSAPPHPPDSGPTPPLAKPPITKPPDPPPVEERKEDAQIREARAAIEAAREKMKSAPQDLDAQLAAWEEAVRKSALTPFFKDASAALNEIRDRKTALKPPVEPEKKPLVPPPPDPEKPPSAEAKAYLARWEGAMGKASARDFEGAAADLGRAAAELNEPGPKGDAKADAEELQRARGFLDDAIAAFSRLPKGKVVGLDVRAPSGERQRIEGTVVRAGNGRAELRRGEETIFVEAEDIAARSLITVLGRDGAEARRAFAVLCVLEGDREGAERLGAGDTLAARYLAFAATAKAPKPSPRELEARGRFYAAEKEFAKTETLAAAVVKYKSLLEDYADTAVVKGERARIQKRTEAGREYVLIGPGLKGTGTFALAPSPRTEVAWQSKSDVEGTGAVENYVEAEFAALPDTPYRCWALVGACCAETFVFYLQTTEGTDLHPKTKQKTSIDPGAGLASLVKHSISGLKKTHEEHKIKGSKTHPKTAAKWEWIVIPLPKYAAPGGKKIRLISDQAGFAVGAVFVTSTRSAFLPEPELKEEAARVRSQAAMPEGLVGWWRLDETSGTAAHDAVEGRPGVLRGNPKWTAGKVGGALKVDAGDQIDIAGSYSFKTITVSAWVRHDAVTQVVQRYVTVGNETAVIRCVGGATLQFYIRTNGELRQLNVGGAMAAGKWTMLTGTWDGVTQKLYKDGVVVASQAPGGTLSDAASGLFLASASEPLVGALDEVRLYNRPLSDAEVQKLFADGSAGTIGDAVPATPATSGKPWKALFDGTTLGFLKHNGNGWKVEDGAVMPVPGVDDAAQTKEQFTDGELRIRFEVKDADRVSFTLRQGGEGGYGIDITRELKALEGKPHELIVIANGDQVTATLDGKPIPVSANGAPKSGHLQFTARGKSIRLLSFEIR